MTLNGTRRQRSRIRENQNHTCGHLHCVAVRPRAMCVHRKREGAGWIQPQFSPPLPGPFLLAGFVKGVIGLGLPTVSIGLLGLVMTPAQAAAILVVPSLVTNVWQAVVGGGLFALARRLWPMLTGICIGTVVGVMLLPHRGRATVWLGLALVIYAAFGLMKGHFVVPSRMETWLGLLMGTATGAITVATGIFVIPGTPYLHSLSFERDKLVQALGLSFTVSTLTLAAALSYTGHLGPSLAGPSIPRRRACRNGVGTTNAGQDQRRNVPGVVFRRPAAAWRPSGAARSLVID